MEQYLCCGKQVNEKVMMPGDIGLWCSICGRKGKAKTKEAAYVILTQSLPSINVPNNAKQLALYAAAHMNELISISAPFIQNSELKRMIDRNIRYAITLSKDNNYAKTWSSDEGKESWIKAIEDSFIYGATLPEMGSIIPFGKVVEFVPAIEAFEFCMTTGETSPFTWTQIDCVYKNDIYEISRSKNGEFNFEIKKISYPRGELIMVVPRGFNKKMGCIIGEAYEVDRLLEKAEQHSTAYKYYLQDKRLYDKYKSEGTLKVDENQREYFIKFLPNKNGGNPYEKKIYYEDIVNPYDGPNRPEMLRKSAGKTFFRPFLRVRQSEAAINETRDNSESFDMDEIVNNVLDQANDIITGQPENNEEKKDQKIEPIIIDESKYTEDGKLSKDEIDALTENDKNNQQQQNNNKGNLNFM